MNCTRCGYSLIGLEGICPECGRPSHRFTDNIREIVQAAKPLARRWLPRHRDLLWRSVRSLLYLNVERPVRLHPCHILMSLLNHSHCMAQTVLLINQVNTNRMLEELKGSLVEVSTDAETDRQIILASNSKSLINRSVEAAFAEAVDWVGTEHLLLALSSGPTKRILHRQGLTPDRILRATREIRSRAADLAEAN